MYNIYFENSLGERRVIGTCNNREELFKVIFDFLEERNFKSYYTRINYLETEAQIDVGSHTEFFYVDKSAVKPE